MLAPGILFSPSAKLKMRQFTRPFTAAFNYKFVALCPHISLHHNGVTGHVTHPLFSLQFCSTSSHLVAVMEFFTTAPLRIRNMAGACDNVIKRRKQSTFLLKLISLCCYKKFTGIITQMV
jgi:hypothetical protein